MESLPLEILENISQYLTATELAACGAVSHQWRELFNNDCLWRPRCIAAFEETLRTTPCVVQPSFISPEVEGGTLSPIGQWRLAFMRENHLWNNWRQGKHKVAYVPLENSCHTFFISNHLIIRVFDNVSKVFDDVTPMIKLYDVTKFPPTLLQEIPYAHEGWAKSASYLDNKFVIFSEHHSIVFNLDLNADNIVTFKFKASLPDQGCIDKFLTTPQFQITRRAILGYNPIKNFSSCQDLHVWDLENGTELKVETSPLDKPYGFSDIITSKTSDNVVIVVSNDVNCESFMLCAHFEPREEIMITFYFHIYNANELKFLHFVEVFEAEHRNRYKCKIHLHYVAIAINGTLKIYNYQSHYLLTEVLVKTNTLGNMLETSSLDVIDNCFAFIVDHTFKMFHPASQTFVAVVDLQVKDFIVISDSIVKMVKEQSSEEIWKIRRQCQKKLCMVLPEVHRMNESLTRVLEQDPVYYIGMFNDLSQSMIASIEGILKCPRLTNWFYFW